MKHYKIKSQNFEASSDLQGELLEIQERLNQLQTESEWPIDIGLLQRFLKYFLYTYL